MIAGVNSHTNLLRLAEISLSNVNNQKQNPTRYCIWAFSLDPDLTSLVRLEKKASVSGDVSEQQWKTKDGYEPR